MCGCNPCGTMSNYLSKKGGVHSTQTLISTIVAVSLVLFGVLASKGAFGGATTGPFVGGALVLSSIPFFLIAGYKSCK